MSWAGARGRGAVRAEAGIEPSALISELRLGSPVHLLTCSFHGLRSVFDKVPSVWGHQGLKCSEMGHEERCR